METYSILKSITHVLMMGSCVALCRDLSLGRVKMNMDGQKYGWTGGGQVKK